MAKEKKLKKIDELKLFCETEASFNLNSLLKSYNVVDIHNSSGMSRNAFRVNERFDLKKGYKVIEVKIVINSIRYLLILTKPYKINGGGMFFKNDEVIIAAIQQMKNGSFSRNYLICNEKYMKMEEVNKYV